MSNTKVVQDYLADKGFDEEAKMFGLKVPIHEWKWFGKSGHHICGQWCRFHLCTQVGEFVISTVGEYVHPRRSGGSEETERVWLSENPNGEDIGLDRKYETFVFICNPSTKCDGPICYCGMPEIEEWIEIDSLRANDNGTATTNHMTMCNKFANESKENYEQLIE